MLCTARKHDKLIFFIRFFHLGKIESINVRKWFMKIGGATVVTWDDLFGCMEADDDTFGAWLGDNRHLERFIWVRGDRQ